MKRQSPFSLRSVWIRAVLVFSRFAFEKVKHNEEENIENRDEQTDQKPPVQTDVMKPANGESDGCDKYDDVENPGEWTDEKNQYTADDNVIDQEIPHFQSG